MHGLACMKSLTCACRRVPDSLNLRLLAETTNLGTILRLAGWHCLEALPVRCGYYVNSALPMSLVVPIILWWDLYVRG